MTFEEEQNKVLNEINTLIHTSPAASKESAQDLSIPKTTEVPENISQGAVNAALKALEQNKQQEVIEQPKEYGLGSVYTLGALKSQKDLSILNEPIDKSVGVTIPATGEATEKIATTRTLSTEGPKDYIQRVSALDSGTTAAASAGVNDGDLHVMNLRAGNAGLNVSTSSTLNPMDGSDGNPAFFNSRYPLLQTTVAPFKVTFPNYNLEVTSETLDPEKLAYQAATLIGGRQIPTYIGYTNSGFDLTESWYSGLAKGIPNVPINLADLGVKGGAFVSTAVNYGDAYFRYGLSKYLFGDNPNAAEKRLAKRLADINYVTDETISDWNKIVDAYKKKLGSDLTEYAGFSAQLFEGIPSVLGQMGAIYGISTLASQAVTSPQAASLLTSAIAGTTFGLAQGGDTFAGLQGAAISPSHRMGRAAASAGASAVLNSLGAWTVFGNKVSAGRQFVLDYSKRLRAAAGKGLIGVVGEGLTETGDQILQDYFTYNMGDDTFANRLDSYTMAFVLGAVGGLVGVPGHISAERMQIMKEQVVQAKVAADAPDMVKELQAGVDALANVGFTREDAWDIIAAMASPEGQEYLKQKQGETMVGMLDRLSPEAIQYAKDLGAKQSEKFMKDLAQLDQRVYRSLPSELDDSTKTMVSRAMRGIASVVTYYGGKFKAPRFVIRNDAPMEYEPKSNTVYINSVATGEAIDLGMVQNKNTRLLDPMQRGLLHELGHMMDYQLGQGTNYKEFMPTYFEAIAKVYGKEKATNVQNKMSADGNRFAFATSTDKADVKEKRQDNATGKINEKNTAEYFAYALGRLGKKVGRALGMGDSEVAQHVDAINIMASTLKIPSIQKQLSRYQKAMGDLVKKNDDTLKAMAEAQGLDELARHIQDFVAGDENALSKEDVLNLYKILKTYTGVDGAAILDEVFKNSKQETFMQRTEREFADAIKESDITVGDVQDKINELNKKVSKGNGQDVISNDDMPRFYDEDTALHEQVAYASMRGPFEGNELDADKHYAEGEALGSLGAGMRHGYGNNVLFNLDKDKKFYYDVWNYSALKHNQPESNIDTHRVMYALEDLAERFPSKISDTNTKAQLIEKFKKQYDSAIKSGDTALKDFTNSILNFMSGYLEEVTGKKISDAQKEDFKNLFAQERVVDKLDKGAMEILEMGQDMYDEMLKSTIHMDNDRLTEYIVTAEMYQDAIKSLNALPENFLVERTKSGAELHSFETPDLEQMLNEDKPLEEQSKYVRDAIKQMAEENPHISLFGGKYELAEIQALVSDPNSPYWSDYIEDDDLANLTGETFRRALNEYFWHDEEGQKERVKFFESRVDQSNKRMLEGATKTDAYRTTSLLLNKYGIKGIEFNGDRDGHGAVIFNGHTKHIERLYEGVFDVSEILNNKKKYVSTLEKRTAEKPDGYNYADDVKAVSGIMAKSGKAPRWFTRFFANGDITMGLWAMGGKDLVEHFDLIGRMNRSANAATDYMLDFDAKLKKTMGFKSNMERDAFENQAAINSIDVDYTVDPLTDEIISTKISPLVAMNLYNNAKNSKTRAKVLNTFGGNAREMERVLGSLTAEQRKYADAMVQYIKDNWSLYKKSYEQEGIEVDDEPYWPVADAVHIALGDRKINSEYARKEDPRGAISLDVDAREVFNHYVQRVSGAKENVYSTIQRIKDLYGYERQSGDDNPTDAVRKLSDDMWKESKKIRGLAIRNLGDEGKYERFLSLVDDFLAKREAAMVGTESLNIAARNLTAGLLQWKPIQFMKNLANAAGFWGLAENQAQYWSDTAWAATHPIEAAKYMFEKVPYIRNRFKGQNIDEALTQQTAGTDSLLMNWAKNTDKLSAGGQQIVSNVVALTQASRRLGYTPMLSGDMAANVIGGYGLLRQYEAQYGDKAGDKLSEAIVMHQASSNQALRSLLQRQWSRDIRGEVLRFGSEGVQKGKSIGLAIAQGVKGERSWGNVSKELLSTMSSMIVFALISAGIIDLFDGDEENDKEVYEALTREGISAVAGFSVVGNSVIAPILSIPFTGEMSTIGTPLTNMLSADLKKLNKGDWEDLVVDGIAATVPVTGLDNLINLAKGGYRSVAGQSEEDAAAGLYQLMGRSESYANKRAGVKKETVEKNSEE